MPIKIPDKLPARTELENEGVEIITRETALRQDVRPLKILLLNLMPKKRETEIQFARLLSNTPLQLELTLMTTASYQPQNGLGVGRSQVEPPIRVANQQSV